VRTLAAGKSLRWLLVVIIMAVITLAVVPESWVGRYPGIVDVVVKDGGHIIGFFLLSSTAAFIYRAKFGKKAVILILFGSAVIAVISEGVQFLSQSRKPNVNDLGLDVSGSALGILAVWQLNKLRPACLKSTPIQR